MGQGSNPQHSRDLSQLGQLESQTVGLEGAQKISLGLDNLAQLAV